MPGKPLRQGVNDILGFLIPMLPTLGRHLVEDADQILGHFRALLAYTLWLLGLVHHQACVHVPSGKGGWPTSAKYSVQPRL